MFGPVNLREPSKHKKFSSSGNTSKSHTKYFVEYYLIQDKNLTSSMHDLSALLCESSILIKKKVLRILHHFFVSVQDTF